MILRIQVGIIVALLIAISVAWTDRAIGQEHTHEGAVGQFYMTWKSPEDRIGGERIKGCCNNVDCSRILEMRRRGNHYEIRVGLAPLNWYPVSNYIWEDNTADPRESPDGLGHACVMAGRVICAVRASDG